MAAVEKQPIGRMSGGSDGRASAGGRASGGGRVSAGQRVSTGSMAMQYVGSAPFNLTEPPKFVEKLNPQKKAPAPLHVPLPAGIKEDLTSIYKCDGKRKQFNVTTLIKDSFASVLNAKNGAYQICAYDLRQLVWFGGFIAGNARGSVFRDAKDIQMWLLAQCVIFTVLTVIFCIAWPDGGIKMDAITNLETYLNSMVPLLLGLYLEVSLWRWWALRADACGTLFDCVTEVSSLASSFILQDGLQERVRYDVGRWGMASCYLIKEAARGRQGDAIAESAVQKRILTEKEAAALEGVSPYVQCMVMWAWIGRCINDNLMKSSGPEPYSNFGYVAFNVCLKARSALHVLHTYTSTALPFTYVHLVSLTVDVTTSVIALKCALSCANAIGEDPPNWQAFVYELLHFLFVPVMYHGLLSVTYIIHDPFGEELADFPMGLFMEHQAQIVQAVRKGDERFPRRDLNGLRRMQGIQQIGVEVTFDEDGHPIENKASASTTASSREVASKAAAHILADVTRETLSIVRGNLTTFAKELNLLVEEVAKSTDVREQATEHLIAYCEIDKSQMQVSSAQA